MVSFMTKITHTRFSGKNLKKERNKAQLSRFKLCQAIEFKISQEALYSYEREKRVPRADVAVMLAKALKIPIKALFDA